MDNVSHIAYLGLGTNMGDRVAHLDQACALLDATGISITQKASLYATDPIGVTDQPEFLNTIIEVHTVLEPRELLHTVKGIEKEVGRIVRHHWGPREIDIDIVLYGTTISYSPDLTIPHPEMKNREFVLLPLSELAPELPHPETGETIRELLEYYYANLHGNTRRARLFT